VKQSFRILLLLPWSLSSWAQTSLNTIEVQGISEPPSAERQSHSQAELEREASGFTLGDYLEHLPLVNSASYGQGVGQPVIRGQSGYRVKILNNDQQTTDLSSMGADHAVAVMPKAAKRIELLKGPASLLYGAQSGGTIRVIDSFNDELLAPPGLVGKVYGSGSTNNQATQLGAGATAANENFSLELDGHRQSVGNYQDGKGQVIAHSDTWSQQIQAIAGYQQNDWLLKAFVSDLEMDYGIPNGSSKASRINLKQQRVGLKSIHNLHGDYLERMQFDLQYTDYLHDETEGGSADGLFGLESFAANIKLDAHYDNWLASFLMGYQQQNLRVCHEHGACQGFSIAPRTGNNVSASVKPIGSGYDQTPYFHGHPMPDTQTQSFTIGNHLEGDFNAGLVSLGAYFELRTLKPDSKNIQENWLMPSTPTNNINYADPDFYRQQTDTAISLSIGWQQPLSQFLTTEVSLSYIERLPSSEELLWNGNHHATQTYIIGNRDLNKERSVTLDWDLTYQTKRTRNTFNLFITEFNDFIYQTPLRDAQGNEIKDPDHNNTVWQTQQANAEFYGASLQQDWEIGRWQGSVWRLSHQADWLSGQLRSGENLPRIPPMSYQIALQQQTAHWFNQISLKQVFKARQLEDYETATPDYQWLSLYSRWQTHAFGMNTELWFKADNLLDQQAANHLSYLKDTAPLIGRQLSAGIELRF
jgi:iron complex outermembrane receptor protein